jgi:hypothetical protein
MSSLGGFNLTMAFHDLLCVYKDINMALQQTIQSIEKYFLQWALFSLSFYYSQDKETRY